MDQNDKNTTCAARACLRAISIADSPELFPDIKIEPSLREDLEQLRYKVAVRLEGMKSKESLLAVTSSYVNDCLGCPMSVLESKAKKTGNSSHTIVSFPIELLNHRILSACCGDFHTLILSKGFLLSPDMGNDYADVYGFGQNIYGQVTGFTKQKHIEKPVVVPFFIGKQVKLIDAKGTRSVAVTESGDIYEWGFPDIAVRKTGLLQGIEVVKIGLTFNL